MGKRSLLVVLLCIFAVALGIRVHFALCSTAKPDYSDMAWYNEVALQGGFPKELPPAYPLFLRAIYALFGKGSYRAVFVVQGLIGAFTAVMIGWIGARVGNVGVGATAGGIAALYPNFIVYSLTTLTETFGLFCVTALSVVLVAEMGVITPPVGINVYVVAGVARDVPLQTIFRGTMHMMIALLLTALFLIAFPQIALLLPGLMKV